MANSLGIDVKDKPVVVAAEHMGEFWRPLERRIGMATGGFGCSPSTMGNAVFVDWAIGGSDRVEGWMLERLATWDEYLDAIGKYKPYYCETCNGKGHYTRPATPEEEEDYRAKNPDYAGTLKMFVMMCPGCGGRGHHYPTEVEDVS